MSGTLYIVGTPIGNLEDISSRALRILGEVAVVYAEDTRVTQGLLVRYHLKTPLRSYREAAERHQVEKTIAEICLRLTAGESLAYVSDAGTPGVSDPGDYLVSRVVDAGFTVVPVPGASALPAILSVAGLGIQHPLFVGFLPKKKGHQTLLASLRDVLTEGVVDGLVLYESPERIVKLLTELLEWKMPLRLCVGRELTKLHEEILRGSVEDLVAVLSKRPTVKGEFVIVISHHV